MGQEERAGGGRAGKLPFSRWRRLEAGKAQTIRCVVAARSGGRRVTVCEVEWVRRVLEVCVGRWELRWLCKKESGEHAWRTRHYDIKVVGERFDYLRLTLTTL